jgi:hypothetical protein
VNSYRPLEAQLPFPLVCSFRTASFIVFRFLYRFYQHSLQSACASTDIKMVSFWGQVLITAILTLQITPITSQNLTSIGSDIDSTIAHLGEDFDAFENDVKDDVESAVRNGGGVLANLTMGVQTCVRTSIHGCHYATSLMVKNSTPPISTRLVTSGIESNVVIGLYCEECGFPQPQAFEFASHNFSGWDSSWLGFALESFDAMIEVDVELNADPDGSLKLELWNITVAQDAIVVEVAFQLYLVAKASASMSFSAGLNLSVRHLFRLE